MNLSSAFSRIFRLALPGLLFVFLLARCSDLVLESDRQPDGLRFDPPRAITIVGEEFVIDVELLDQNGDPFENIPGWVDTTFTGTSDILEVRGDEVVTLQPGVTELGIEIAGLFESILVRVAPRLYMTQSIQRLDRTIRMVAGRQAVIRLFLQGEERNIDQSDVVVNIYQNGKKIDEKDYPAQSVTPKKISDNVSALDLPVPAQYIQPGLAVSVTVGDTTYSKNGSPSVIDVHSVPEFHIRLIPIHVSETGQTGNVNSSNIEVFVEELLDMFPINPVDGFVADLHPPVTVNVAPSSDDFYLAALQRVRAVWMAEGSPDFYYYGVIPQTTGGVVGLGYIALRQAVGWDRMPGGPETLAHELGHNLSLLHTPCGGPASPDPNYPYPNGSIGKYGFEVDESELKSPLVYKSFMSYCSPTWMSDYEYNILFNYRLAVNDRQELNQQPQDVLLVWGRVSNNELILEPAFRISAPANLPDRSGPYALSGYDKNGSQLFSISFAGSRVDHKTGVRTFAFTIPVSRVNIDELETLRLSGVNKRVLQQANVPARVPQRLTPDVTARPSGVQGVTLDWSSSRYRMALVKNARTGEVIGFTSGGASELKTDAQQLKLYFSDGVHTTTTIVTVQ